MGSKMHVLAYFFLIIMINMKKLHNFLFRAGLLQVYIRTSNNVLIEINPATRVPRTFKRFAGQNQKISYKIFFIF
jgi:rRNA pseudouridine-1189 N-methylase Emg1 (Nep1/Mra1 family)